jgi:hypothetical protein
MDETYDIIRAVRDKRFKYIRNHKPGRPNSAQSSSACAASTSDG